MATATQTEVKPADGGTAATGENAPTAKPLNKKIVEQIIAWEAEADGLTGEADQFRAQAAGHMVKLMDGGATERQVAEAINKSNSHVHFATTAWKMMQGEDFKATGDDRFNQAYKLAKRPAKTESDDSESSDGDVADQPFPKWAGQVRLLNRVVCEMIEQANEKQIKQFNKIMEKGLKNGVSKEDDFANAAPAGTGG